MSGKYTDEEFAEIVKSQISIAGVLRALGRAYVGTNYTLVRKEVARLSLDTTHWLGQKHGTSGRRKVFLPDLLIKGSNVLSNSLKKRLFKEGLLKKECSECGMSEWRGKPAPLQLDHIDGERTNNLLSNLRILCANCHAQTDTYCGKNARKNSDKGRRRRSNSCEDRFCACGSMLSSNKASHCKKCEMKRRSEHSKIIWPSCEEIIERVNQSSYTCVAKEMGVSDNAIRKHLKVRGMLN